MATEKTLQIVIEEKGGDKLKDTIKDIKIEAISAEEMIQKIAKDAPNAASKIEKTLKNLYVSTGKLADVRHKNELAMKEMFKSFYGQNEELTKRTAQLSSSASKMVITIEQIQGLTEKNYKTLKETSAAKLAASQAEIDGLTKNAKSIEQVIKAYEKKKDAIIEQNNIAKAAIISEYDAAKKSGGDIVALEKLKSEQIALIDAKQKKDLTQNTKEYQASAKALNDKLFSSMTANSEVEVKKVSGTIKKEIKNAAADAAKALGLPADALKDVANAAIKTAGETKKVTAETQKAGEAAAKTGETAAKTAEATKKIIDIHATRANIQTNIKELAHYRAKVEETGLAVLANYDVQIAAAENDTEKKKKLEAEKAQAVKFYGSEIIKYSQAMAAEQKKIYELENTELKQYADNVKTATAKVSEYFGTAFSSISNVYKAEIDSIDEDIKQLKNKNAEITQITTGHESYLKNLKAQKAAAEDENNQEIVNSLDAKIKEEEKLYKESLKTKQDYDVELEELNRKKAKKQAEQEKIEKLKRKADLIKSIGEATANVAQGVTKALAFGPFIGPVLAGIVAAAGVVQIGIMTKQLAKFEDGGLLKGKRHSQGGMRIEGTNIEVEGGEYVVNRESTSKNIGLVRYINSQRKELTPTDINAYFSHAAQGYEPPFSRMFESGGEMPKAEMQRENDNKALLEAIKNIKIEPKVAVTDIHRVQDEMINVSGWSGM